MRKFIAAITLCALGFTPIVSSLSLSPAHSTPGTVADGGTQPLTHTAVRFVADGGTQPLHS